MIDCTEYVYSVYNDGGQNTFRIVLPAVHIVSCNQICFGLLYILIIYLFIYLFYIILFMLISL
jgi:hypothetical protein